MTTRAVSPGGALLRTSRLFSLPSPLPERESLKGGINFLSETRTTTVPRYQSITTPKTSRIRGDWGLKRPLPRKAAANTTTPVVRIKHIDSKEHITDYAHAGDHTITLEKFKELNLPITTPPVRGSRSGKSVFEDAADFTAIEPGKLGELNTARWRFHGPWLAGMTGGEFDEYIKKVVLLRRREFKHYVKEQLAKEKNKSAASRALDSGGDEVLFTAKDFTDGQVAEHLRKLRQNHSREKLFNLVGEFLDLAPLQPFDVSGQGQSTSAKSVSPYAKDGPPSTHPSAGISYLRTDAYIENHPIYGPQQAHTPVEARMVVPRSRQMTKLGVAGILAEAPGGDTFHNLKGMRSEKNEMFSDARPGGLKQHVHPTAATVMSRGELNLKLNAADAEAVLVKQELDGGEPLFGDSSALNQTRQQHPLLRKSRYSGLGAAPPSRIGSRVMGNSESYGMGFSKV